MYTFVHAMQLETLCVGACLQIQNCTTECSRNETLDCRVHSPLIELSINQ